MLRASLISRVRTGWLIVVKYSIISTVRAADFTPAHGFFAAETGP
jgi:hypothetical protein